MRTKAIIKPSLNALKINTNVSLSRDGVPVILPRVPLYEQSPQRALRCTRSVFFKQVAINSITLVKCFLFTGKEHLTKSASFATT